MRGSLALGANPSDLEWDMAWGRGGVQQVWGLGVPAWQLPFDALSRVFGHRRAPDRLVFCLAIAVVSYGLIRLFVFPAGGVWRPEQLAGVFLLIVYPPFLTLCQTWFHVYEEVVAYAYLAGIALFGGTVWFFRKPTMKRYLILGLFCGLVSFVRPTAGIYGAASLCLAWFHTRRLAWPRGRSWAGPAVFACGAALLFTTNLARFGSGFEFGHRLSLNSYPAMRFASRFDHPYRTEPLSSASRELFSLLFLTRDSLFRKSGYDTAFFAGQSSTFRWRDLYFSTYDLTFLGMVLAAWGWCGWDCWRHRSSPREGGDQVIWRIGGVWSFLVVVPLLGFYLRFPFISSRYLLDFAPALAVATWICYQGILKMLQTRMRARWAACFAGAFFVVWWGYQTVTAKIMEAHSQPFTLERGSFEVRLKSAGAGNGGLFGSGWNRTTGETKAAIALLVRDPQRLELDVEGSTVPPEDWSWIRAKIGLEFLELEGISEISGGRRLIFRGPRRREYQSGQQVAFVAFMSPDELHEGNSRFRLLRANWGNGGSD